MEALYRATGLESLYGSTGAVYFKLNQWNCFLSTYDGTYLRSYLNGKAAGILELADTPLKDTADIGVGGSEDGSNFVQGWIDELRYYSVPISSADAKIAYGDGYGDLGAVPILDAPLVNPKATPVFSLLSIGGRRTIWCQWI